MNAAAKHPFAAAGYVAPYRFLAPVEAVYQACADAPVQAAGSCDVCGTCFRYGAKFADANGVKFITGCDCAVKSLDSYDAAGNANTITRVKMVKRDMVNAAARARSAAKRADAAAERKAEWDAKRDAEIAACNEVDFAKLATMAHSQGWAADKGLTRADEVKYWMEERKNFRTAMDVAEQALADLASGDFTPATVLAVAGDSKHIGEVKERLVFKGSVVAKIWFDTFYGSSCIVKVVTEAGDIVAWKTSAPWGIAPVAADGGSTELNVGDSVQFKATVKSHDTDSYNDDKPCTWVARAKAFTPKAKKARKAKGAA
jgi:hypothetical protein